MSRFLTSWVLSAAALAVAAGLLGSHMDIGGPADTAAEQLGALAVISAIFAVVNLFVAPVVKVLSLPFIVLSLGLFLLVINALLLQLTSVVAGALDVPFHLDGFGWAVLASIVVSIVNALVGGGVKNPR